MADAGDLKSPAARRTGSSPVSGTSAQATVRALAALPFMQIACAGGKCYLDFMAVHLQIRDLPDDLHETLRRRAALRELSLRQYTLEVLQAHCRQPTVDEWLDGLDRLTPVELSLSAAEAVCEAREADDAALMDVLGRS